MFCIISDSKVAFSSQLTSPLFISSDFPSKPLLKTVGDDKPKSLHVLLATKLAEFFFFCTYLLLMTIKRSEHPQALTLSPRCPRAPQNSPLSCSKTQVSFPHFSPLVPFHQVTPPHLFVSTQASLAQGNFANSSYRVHSSSPIFPLLCTQLHT